MFVLPAVSMDMSVAVPGFLPFQAWAHVEKLEGGFKLRYVLDGTVRVCHMRSLVWPHHNLKTCRHYP